MNIALLCISKAWGGLEMNVYRLAVRLRERGNTVTLVATPGTPIYEKAQQEGLPIVALSVKLKYFDVKAAAQLARLLKGRRINALIFSVAKDNYVAGWAKLFFYPRLQLYYLQQMQLGVPKKGLVQTLLYRSLDAWIAPLHLLAQQVQEKTRMPVKRICVIPLGIDVKQYEGVKAERVKARAHFSLPSEAFVAGIIGRIDPAKGQEYLIRAAANLQGLGKTVHVLIVGEETRGDTRQYLPYLQQLAKELDAENLVHFRPYIEQTSLAYAALDVFVMASLGETYGMVTVEAMAAGLSVIGTDSGGTPELLGNGQHGLLIPPQDEKALAQALAALIDQPTREQLGQSAQDYARHSFDYKVQCQALEKLLGGV